MVTAPPQRLKDERRWLRRNNLHEAPLRPKRTSLATATAMSQPGSGQVARPDAAAILALREGSIIVITLVTMIDFP
jgi:hypothetical protein